MASENQFRAEFDAAVTFANGGSLQAEGFRVDVPNPDVDEVEVAHLFVRSLGLLMTERVEISGLRVFPELHKGTRGGPSDDRTPSTSRRLVDLSHVIHAGMTTYPGLPGPTIEPHLTREASRRRYPPGTEFAIDHIAMVGNTGTYLDTPYHRYPDGFDLAALDLAAVAEVPAVVVRTTASGVRGVTPQLLAPFDVTGKAVLLHTGGDVHFGTPRYAENAPFLTADAAGWLVEQQARIVGIDAVNIDDVDGDERPAHTRLLAAGIPVIEHLTRLEQVPAHGAQLTAVPPMIAAFGTFPVRAFVAIP